MHRTKKRKKKPSHPPKTMPPQEVFVQYSGDKEPDERYLLASESVESAFDNSSVGGGDNQDLIGVYRLVRVVKVKRETKFIETEVK